MSKTKKNKIPIAINIPVDVLIGYNEIRTWIYNCNDATALRNLGSLMNLRASKLEPNKGESYE